MAREFSTAEAAGLCGATARMLGHWAKTGLLRPSGREAAGKGTRRRYTFRDLVAIQTIIDLRNRGCPLHNIRAAVKYLRSNDPRAAERDALSRLTLLTDGKRVYVPTDERQAMEVLTGQSVWAIPLGLRIIETNARVRKLPQVWTEEVTVRDKVYHLRVEQDPGQDAYIATCRELPGALHRGETPDEAVAQAAEAIKSVVAYMSRHGGRVAPDRTGRSIG